MSIKPGLNPWITMWTQPGRTIREIINTNPRTGFFFLASIWFLQFFFIVTAYRSLIFPINWLLTVLIAIVLSPIAGSICFYVFGWLVYVTGKWLKGTASPSSARCAFAWSRIPLIIDLIMWFVISLFVSEMIFNRFANGMSFVFINLIACLTSVWSFVLLVAAVKEIQKFSLSKAILNIAIVYLILVLFYYLILFLYLL